IVPTPPAMQEHDYLRIAGELAKLKYRTMTEEEQKAEYNTIKVLLVKTQAEARRLKAEREQKAAEIMRDVQAKLQTLATEYSETPSGRAASQLLAQPIASPPPRIGR